ncbi:MAG: hypothetical protein JKX76_01635 [Colwellia sp.]|nr:hypothetical protein [Colwellia sp.]
MNNAQIDYEIKENDEILNELHHQQRLFIINQEERNNKMRITMESIRIKRENEERREKYRSQSVARKNISIQEIFWY